MPSYLPEEYDDIKNWGALKLAIDHDYSTDEALRMMKVDPQRPIVEHITKKDITAMIQFKNDGMSIKEISSRFYITPQECEEYIVGFRKYRNDKYVKSRDKKGR